MTEQAEALQLGWLRTGRMGAAMVRRLHANGCDVTVYNRTAAKAAPLTELGAKAVGSIAELAGCDIALTALAAPADLISALTGPEGHISGRVPGRSWSMPDGCPRVPRRPSGSSRAIPDHAWPGCYLRG